MKLKVISGIILTLFLVNMLTMVGSVSAQLTGDVNGDDKVDICDGVLIGAAFGSEPGDPNWNPNADIAPDNVTNIQDVVLWATHFG